MDTIYMISDYENNYINRIYEYLSNYNIKVLGNSHSNNIYYLENIQDNIVQSIDKSSVVIVVCEKITINIALEIGIAIGQGKKIFVFSDKVNDLPFFLKDMTIYQIEDINENMIDKILTSIYENSQKIKLFNSKTDLINKYNDDKELIFKLNSKDFEDLVFQTFIKKNILVNKNMNKFGYDFISKNKDKSGIIFEVKKLQKNSKVSINYIQQFFGIMNAIKADKGVFISNVEFTPTATDFAKMLEGKVLLITYDEIYNEFFKNINDRNIVEFISQ